MPLPAVTRYETTQGIRIYRIPVEALPNNFIVYCYVVLGAGEPTLIDSGSDIGESSAHLVAGFDALRDQFGETLAFTDIRRLWLTHAHIDHFGGAAFVQAQTGARIGIHALDRRVVEAFPERIALATQRLNAYFVDAGIPSEEHADLLEMYGFFRQSVRNVQVAEVLEDGTTTDGMTFFHTPGHGAGQVCILIGDILLSADHVLAHITPHQSPEAITHGTGLGHYLASLTKIEQVAGVRVALGGHDDPILDFYGRVSQTRQHHQRRLARVLDLLHEPMTIAAVTHALYPGKQGYDVLLALEEAGAHIEYLYEHGELAIVNTDHIQSGAGPLLYRRA